MGSKTAWRRVQDDPSDNEAWNVFVNLYWTPVVTYVGRRVGDPDRAQDVCVTIFDKLRRRVQNSSERRVVPNEDGRYQSYVWAVVRSAVAGYFTSLKREKGQTRSNLSADELAALTAGPDLDDLESDVKWYAGIEPELELWKSRYESAVRCLKASPHFDPTSFRVFLLVYHRRLTGDRIDSHPDFDDLRGGKAWSRGMATKHARRIRNRLIKLMGLPEPVAPAAAPPGAGKHDRSQLIVQLMALNHGDPS